MNYCLYCGKETINPKFCSKSCSASNSNKVSIKRKKKIQNCITCGIELPILRPYRRRITCSQECIPGKQDWSLVTLEEMRLRRGYQRHSAIRTLARAIYSGPYSCYVCGYDKHVDICHIKGINSFSPESKISEINALSNLVALCKNHHWEFDNGLLQLQPSPARWQ